MSSRSSFFRKIVYLAVIAALLLPLRWFSHPATIAFKDVPASPGGKFAQFRDSITSARPNWAKSIPPA